MSAPIASEQTDLLEPEPELLLEPDPGPPVSATPAPVMEVLPADFPLPLLIRFVPDVRLRDAAQQAATYALGVEVREAEGLRLADTALTALKDTMKAIEAEFFEPVKTANELHKRLTTLRGDWLKPGTEAVEAVGRRIWNEKRRLDAIEAEARRKEQEEADRKLREQLRADAQAAKQQEAPAPVVEELERQAKTATAPPVSTPSATAAALKGSSTVTTWKARLAGTPASDEPNPDIEGLTPAQRLQVFDLLRAVLDGKAPIAALQINWSYLNKRAKADKGTLAIPGIESYEDGGVRAKGTRSR